MRMMSNCERIPSQCIDRLVAAGIPGVIKKSFAVLSISIMLASVYCSDKRYDKNTIKLADNASLCDSCLTVIKIQHDECTDCADLRVDSGMVYFSRFILQKADSLVRADSLLQRYYVDRSAGLNTRDLLLADTVTFDQLWSQITDYYNDSMTMKTFKESYIVAGKIVDIKVQKRMGFNVLTPVFKLDKIIDRQLKH